ncbi:MAG: hypothetical protein U1E27_08625, partial [Kiritimatiellia bacterium]|nr:hypothetical protein [Kiritimatiellia bacterium]
MKPEMLFLSGWAHAASALEPLAEAVQPWPECRFGSLHPSPRDSELPNDLQALVRYTHSLPVPPIGIGWSGGGIRALDAADHGALWSGLVLISSTARFCSDREDTCGTPHAQLRA